MSSKGQFSVSLDSQTDKRAVHAVHALLTKRFPNAFPKDYDAIRPLKLGIHADLIARAPDLDPVLLRRALANHTQRDGYWLALIHGRGDRRYDLDGNPVSTVTPEERAEAQKRLEASTQRGQDRAERVRTHKEREEQRKKQREIERKNREAKAARKAEHERIQTRDRGPQGGPDRPRDHAGVALRTKSRLVREAAERAARKAQGPRPADRSAGETSQRLAPRPARDVTGPERRVERTTDRDERSTRAPGRAEPAPDRPMPPVAFRRKRRVASPPDEK